MPDLHLFDPETEQHDDVQSREEKLQKKLERAREKCMQAIRNAVALNPNILTEADETAFAKEVISDEGFAMSGITDTAEKIKMIQENITTYIPRIQRESRALADKFERQIRDAEKQGWIGRQSAERWMDRLRAPVVYWNKKKFIEVDMDKFKAYMENWKKVADERKKLLTNKNIKSIKTAEVPQIRIFMNDNQFLNLSYEARQSLVATVTAALAAKEKRMPKLFAQAKAMLEGAAKKGALNWSKVGGWLQRIFAGTANPDDVEKFLNNQGDMPLQKLIANWTEASKKYQKIETKRKALGTPRGFHFVSLNVFLNWKYDQRTAYLDEAEDRFADINKEPYLFLKIRHELGAKDWDGAADLIDGIHKEIKDGTLILSQENNRKLQVMEMFLRQHRAPGAAGQPEQKPSPGEVLAQMQALLDQVPPQLRPLYVKALKKGYQSFWALTTLMYNRVWCHQHGFLDTGKERRMEGKAKDETRERMKEGHTRYGTEVNVVKDDTSARSAIRDQSGVRGAQVLYTDERSSEIVVDEIDRKKNDRNFWYWTSVIPDGVQYPEHLFIVSALHPQMKKLARQMAQMGIRYGSDKMPSDAPAKPMRKAA